MAFGGSYVTPDEFRSMQQGFDLSGIEDADLTALATIASRLAESWANATWAKESYNERHDFRLSRRVYVRNWPVISVDEVKIYLGSQVYANIAVNDVLIQNTARYIEIISLAFATSLTGSLITLGISEPVVDITYQAGYATIPDDVKTAVAIMTGAQLANRRLIEEGIAGALSFTIGSYMVTIGRQVRSASGAEVFGAGFSGTVPEAAQALLSNYRMTLVR